MEKLTKPTCLASDKQNRLYVFDAHHRLVLQYQEEGFWIPFFGRSGGATRTRLSARGPLLDEIRSMVAGDDGDLFLAETFGYRIWRIREQFTGEVIAGNSEEGYTKDGQKLEGKSIGAVYAMAPAENNRLMFFESVRLTVRKFEIGGAVTTFGGNNRLEYTDDGLPFAKTACAEIAGFAFDRTARLLFCDRVFNIIRARAFDDMVVTICGVAQSKGFNFDEGPGAEMLLNKPTKILVDEENRLFIVDRGNKRILKANLNQRSINVQTLAGGRAQNGTETAQFGLQDPYDIALDSAGCLFGSDAGNGSVFQLDKITGGLSVLSNTIQV